MLPEGRKYSQFQWNYYHKAFSDIFGFFLAFFCSDRCCNLQRLVKHRSQGRGGTWENTRPLAVLQSTEASSEGSNPALALGVGFPACWSLMGKMHPQLLAGCKMHPLPWPRDTLQVSTDQTTSFSLSTCSHFCVFQSTLFPLFPSYSTLYCTFILFHANNWIYYVKLYILLSIHIQLGFHLLK